MKRIIVVLIMDIVAIAGLAAFIFRYRTKK